MQRRLTGAGGNGSGGRNGGGDGGAATGSELGGNEGEGGEDDRNASPVTERGVKTLFHVSTSEGLIHHILGNQELGPPTEIRIGQQLDFQHLAAFTPNASELILVKKSEPWNETKEVVVINAWTGQIIRSQAFFRELRKFRPQNNFIGIDTADGYLYLWYLNDGSRQTVKVPEEQISSLPPHPGTRIVVDSIGMSERNYRFPSARSPNGQVWAFATSEQIAVSDSRSLSERAKICSWGPDMVLLVAFECKEEVKHTQRKLNLPEVNLLSWSADANYLAAATTTGVSVLRLTSQLLVHIRALRYGEEHGQPDGRV